MPSGSKKNAPNNDPEHTEHLALKKSLSNASTLGIGGIFFLIINLAENKKVIREIAKAVKKLLPIIIVTEIIGVAAELTLNLAISRGSVSLVKVIEGIQPMFVLLIALGLHPFWPKYFREAEDGKLASKLVLMAVIVIGLGVISVGAKV